MIEVQASCGIMGIEFGDNDRMEGYADLSSGIMMLGEIGGDV